MEFNFSKMCNLGAKAATGEYVLFLNDDIEAIDDVWLDAMLSHAQKKHVGAVGAKLYYPDSNTIQHAGITNLRLGPVHKMQFLQDVRPYYDGRNIFDCNVIAVTGACLMVRKTVFEECGGFSEDLAVAFNDVELCFRLYEAGYYNVQCNSAVLYHHESLSRGNDESKEKYPSYVEESKNDFVHTQIREKPFWDSRLVGGERKNQFYEENGQQLAPTLSYEEEPLPVIPSLEDSYYEYEPVVSIHDNFLTGISNAEQEEKDEVLNKSVMKKEVMSFRILAVRCFFALLILAGVILADKMNLSYKNHTADLIKTALHSNKEMNKVEDMLMDLTKSSNP